MMNPIAFAILIIIVVFMPLFSLTGLEGKLFKPMALTITFAMAGSLLLSLTLVPVLAALILKPKEEKDTFIVARTKRLLPAAARLGAGAQARRGWRGRGAADRRLVALPIPRQGFVPQLQEGSIMFRITGIPSTSLDESIRVSNVVDAKLRAQFPQVRSVLATIGRAEKGETADVNYMEVLLDLKPQSEWPRRSRTASWARTCRRCWRRRCPPRSSAPPSRSRCASRTDLRCACHAGA